MYNVYNISIKDFNLEKKYINYQKLVKCSSAVMEKMVGLSWNSVLISIC